MDEQKSEFVRQLENHIDGLVEKSRSAFSISQEKYDQAVAAFQQFVINDELLLEKSDQESGPFLIPLVVVPIGTTTSAISNSPSGSSNWNYH